MHIFRPRDEYTVDKPLKWLGISCEFAADWADRAVENSVESVYNCLYTPIFYILFILRRGPPVYNCGRVVV